MARRYTHLFVLFGAVLINTTTGLGMIYGNLATYIYSYYYSQPEPNFHPILDEAWMNGLCATCSAFGVLGVRLTRSKVGLKLTAAFAIVLSISSFVLTYFTVQHSLWATAATYTVLGGFGSGLAVSVTVLFVSGWFEKSVGIACGLAISSSGIGGFALNRIITAYINPGNIAPDARHGEISYFSQAQIIERTPMVFVIIGIITTAIQVPGLCMLKEAPVSSSHVKILPENHGKYYTLNSMAQVSPLTKKVSDHDMEASEVYEETSQCLNIQSVDMLKEKTPNEVLKMEVFYNAWFSVFAQALGLLIASTYYKLFAQLWIADDEFLAITGGFSCLLTALFRLLCGSLVDKFGLKNTLSFHLASTAILMSLWYFTAIFNKWLYLIWTNVLLSLCGTQFVLYPVLNIKLFGSKHFAMNMFFIQSARVVVMLALPPFLTFALNGLGWFGLFCLGASINFASLLLVVIRMQPTT